MASVASATSGASAIIENGQIVNQTTPQQKAEKAKQDKATNSAAAQKDQFLQLLVAQMKYQDPLQPTSNTEYISQYATFSSLEQMQNMSATLTMGRANEMVGKQVVIHHKETSAGATQEIEGIVDYVTYENNKAKVFVNGSAYDVDEVYAVLGDSFQQASELAESFEKEVNSLPSVAMMTTDDMKKVENLAVSYDDLDKSPIGKSAKGLIDPEVVQKLLGYVTQLTNAGLIGDKAREDETKKDDVQPVDETNPDATQAQEQSGSANAAEKAEGSGSEDTDGEGTDAGDKIVPADDPMNA